jgi:uncharacterized protein YdeI (YjbR/CyaY-like superfamily)
MSNDIEIPIKSFESAAAWEEWLSKNGDSQQELWLKIAKKASGITTVTYDEALDVALCYGWIDGLVNKYDDKCYIQRFTPRRSKSVWSKRNVGKVAELTKAGRMKAAGLAQVEAAKKNGRWQAAYDSKKEKP